MTHQFAKQRFGRRHPDPPSEPATPASLLAGCPFVPCPPHEVECYLPSPCLRLPGVSMDVSLRSVACLLGIGLLATSAIAPAATKTAKFNVTAKVENDCTVAATDLAFGNVGLISSNVDSTSTISITCTPTTAYKVGLDAGNVSGSTIDTRLMSSGPETLQYQ